MTNPKIEIYHYDNDNSEYWVIPIPMENPQGNSSYIQDDGSVGDRYHYPSEKKAQAAKKLFYKKLDKKPTPETIIEHKLYGYWIVYIKPKNSSALKRYIRTGGYKGNCGGSEYRYYTFADARTAEKLFHKRCRLSQEKLSAEKNPNRYCEDCAYRATCTIKDYQPASYCTRYIPILPAQKEPIKIPNLKSGEHFDIEISGGIEKKEMREFESGATRDTAEGKLDYVKALSPIVLERYVQYLNAHRKQADGSMRAFDNWKKGIPVDTYLEGLGRHFLSAWMLAQGYSAEDNHGPVTLEDSLCAIIFGASGWLHEIIKDKRSKKTSKSISAEDLAVELGISETCSNPEFRMNVGCTKCLNENCTEREKD